MKRNLIRLLKIILVLIPVFVLVFVVPVSESPCTSRIKGYYAEEDDSLDVVFLGSSEVFNNFSSVLAYEEFGFTSYPYGVEQNPIELFSSQLKEINRTQSPQRIVIEINGALYPKRKDNFDQVFATYMLGVPFSAEKIKTINEYGNISELYNYCIPFMMSHANIDYKNIFSDTINKIAGKKTDYLYLKGNVSCTGDDFNGNTIDVKNDESKKSLSANGEENLIQFLEFCKISGYDNLIFVSFPHRITTQGAYERFQMANYACEIIESYGYDYLNLEKRCDDIGLDYKTDFYNDDHMNIYGQQKLTRYFSEILVNDYGVTPVRLSESNKAKWDACVKYNHLYYEYFDITSKNNSDKIVWFKKESEFIDLLDDIK